MGTCFTTDHKDCCVVCESGTSCISHGMVFGREVPILFIQLQVGWLKSIEVGQNEIIAKGNYVIKMASSPVALWCGCWGFVCGILFAHPNCWCSFLFAANVLGSIGQHDQHTLLISSSYLPINAPLTIYLVTSLGYSQLPSSIFSSRRTRSYYYPL